LLKFPILIMHYERKLFKEGFNYIAGIDEAGRGAWAGPLFVGAVILPIKNLSEFGNIKDSKKLTAKTREILEDNIKQNCVSWAVGKAESYEIDELGLQNAHLLAVERAFLTLKQYPDYVLVDRIAKVKFPIPFENIIKADDKFLCVGAASIIAKVGRDREMIRLAKEFPEFKFEDHKGYGTKLHQDLIDQYGLCKIHRRLFSPIRQLDKDLHLL